MSMSEHTMKSWDGVELFYRAWRARTPSDRALLVFHRGHEHSGRVKSLVEDLGLDGVHVFAWDARGHGRSPGERGYAENLAVMIKDVDAFVRFISNRHGVPIENMVVLAHSVGAAIVAAWVHDFARPIRGMVLAVPAFRVKLYVPLAIPLLRLRQAVFGKGFVRSYVKAKMLTHDPEQAAGYLADEAIFRQIAVNILLDLHDTSTRILADAGAIIVPTLLLGAGSDWVVKLSAQRTFFDRLSSPAKEFAVLPGFYHAIFHEKDRHLPIAKSREFIRKLMDSPPERAALLDADRKGHTKKEFDRLGRASASPLWAIQRLGMKTVGRLSRGIQLGWRTGFDSGMTLDYVYQNQPRGITALGRTIDRSYLNSVGWRGIRQRKVNLEKVLLATMRSLHAEGRPVRLLDIASGPGRYILEAVRQVPEIPVTALLRDYKPENIAEGRRLAGQMGLGASVTCVQGDAFDRASLAGITPRPTIAVVSGLYELYPDNGRVLTSLRGLAEAVEEGGYLIYTNQPWHPQVEFIARVLINREGRPWVMRRRTTAEMDDLARAAGFEKLDQEIDPWGIFTVSVARRRR
jgi:alpha-beta hydrolase superfamily lysophospholipase/SAM-dependent methyltransferase